jgi:hypothetical protein
MANLYATKENEPAPVVPDFLRGKFFEIYDPKVEENTASFEEAYVGWVWFKQDGTVLFGEPGE